MPSPAVTPLTRLRMLQAMLAGSILLVAAAHAQMTGGGAVKTVNVVRTSVPPSIDGHLDEPMWSNAAVVSDFHQLDPIEYAEASDATEVYVLYGDDALYIGARMRDSAPDSIVANVLRQGAVTDDDDQFFVVLDPFNTNRVGYQFQVNPNGVRREGLFIGPNQIQWDWQGIWETAAIRDEQGWVAEIAIPFKTLSFDPASDSWGINFGRRAPAKNERMAWVSRNRMQTPAIAGRAVGFSELNQGIGLDVVPSLTTIGRKDFELSLEDTAVEPSLDAYYRLTPSLNGSLTINTDFSATEVDDRQVNLTRFSLFFPEKRGFFLQDADAFEFGGFGTLGNFTMLQNVLDQNGRPFFSRRIGLSASGQFVDLNYGAKVSGRAGPWNLGTLIVRQDQFQDIEATDLFVGRAALNVLGESLLGIVVTDGDPRTNLDNTVFGADFRYLNTRLPNGKPLQGEVWYQQSETEGLLGDNSAYGVRWRMPGNTGLRAGVGFKEIQQNFNPALGFVNRRGIRDYTTELGWIHRNPASAPIRVIHTLLGYERIELIDGGLQSEVLNWRALHVSNRAGDVIRLLYRADKEVLLEPFVIWNPSPDSGEEPVVIAPGAYSWAAPGIELETFGGRKLAGRITLRQGDFYDGQRDSLETEITWFPTSHFRAFTALNVDDISLPEGDFKVQLARVGLDFIFSNKLSWVNLIQYDNDSETVGVNSRLQWVPQAGREGFIVLNHNLTDIDKDDSFHSSYADLSIKFSYTFRF